MSTRVSEELITTFLCMPDILVGAADAYFDNLIAMGLLGARVSKGQVAVQKPEGKGNVTNGTGKGTFIMVWRVYTFGTR